MSPLQRLEGLAARRCRGQGPAHDYAHVCRVRGLAGRLARAEGADVVVCELGALLHELVNFPKNHPRSAASGDVCARHARRAVIAVGYPLAVADHVGALIADHAFSKGALPKSLEAKILQDADRLDAIGAIGVARCFATAGELGSAFYDPLDPFAAHRPLDDKRFALDHFERKLLKLCAGMHTAEAQRIAARRDAVMRSFLDALRNEIA